jgi:hypothetical protein
MSDRFRAWNSPILGAVGFIPERLVEVVSSFLIVHGFVMSSVVIQ